MIAALIVLQLLTLAALMILFLRRPATSADAEDPRLAQLLAADLPGQFTRLDARSEALDSHIRAALVQMRADIAAEAQRTRETSSAEFGALRTEIGSIITNLGATLNTGLDGFRSDNKTSAETLRSAVQKSLDAIDQRLASFTSQSNSRQLEAQTALHDKLTELGAAQTKHQDQLRSAVEAQLNTINQSNEKKLDQMRQTVDEKLESTLHTRLTQSFGQVATHLGEVQKGLGEMKELAVGVGDLKKVLSNVKSRGIVGEFFLGQQLEQMFAPDQYVANARVKSGTLESVEYALKVPNGPDSTLYLALDSKFPMGDWERLEEAYENGSEEDRKRAGTAFEKAIRAQAKLICEKYIDPLTTLPFAIMYLPTAALYAEVMRRPGLHAEIQSQCKVVIAGPSDFSMILTSFQMVFRTLKFQKNLNEIWKVFQVAQTEFEKFGGLMEKIENQVGTVQKTLKEIGGKTKTVNRAFRNATQLDLGSTSVPVIANGKFDGHLPLLAASEDE